MLKKVTITTNPVDLDSYETFDVPDLCAFLLERFDGVWPETARIYHQNVSQDHDVTPSCGEDIEKLQTLEGPFYVVVYPGYFIAIIIMVVMMVVTMMMTPGMPNIPNTNKQNQSPNNELSNRTNNARPGKRIPDIYGTVRSTPDLLAVPYRVFKNHEEIEYAYMCIGRGSYDVSDIRDGNTLISDIAGASVEVYGPNTSPNSGDAPQLSIGDAIDEPVLRVSRSNSVNGQVLRAPNDMMVRGNLNIRFHTPNEIQLDPTVTDIDFTKYFQAGDPLAISNAQLYTSSITETRLCKCYSGGYFEFEVATPVIPEQYTVGKSITLSGLLVRYILYYVMAQPVYGYYDLSGIYEIETVEVVTASPDYFCRITLVDPEVLNPQWNALSSAEAEETYVAITCPSGDLLFNLDGAYTILTVSALLITLSSPSVVQPDWAVITTTQYLSPLLSSTSDRWVGPFTLDVASLTQVFSNFVAVNGLYKDDGYNQIRVDVTIELELTPIDVNGYATGAAETFQGTIEGTSTFKVQRAITVRANPTFTGLCEVRARRVTLSDLDFAGSVVDEVKWRDLYSVIDVTELHFGDVTTIQSITYATAGALVVKERKLNLLASRKVATLNSDETMSTTLSASSSIADIIPAVCLDPFIGNRNVEEIDLTNIYDTVAEIIAYFGSEKAAEFNYTFDDDNLSFEETIITIAQAAFCQPYRYGNVIKLLFEKETEDSSLLFNHRNKLPGTENRTISFGNANDNDGVEYEYVDDTDGSVVTFYVPEDKSAVNPRKMKSLGVSNKLQAHFQAYRLYNKIRYQNIGVEFNCTQEAAFLTVMERILVADNTRPDTQDGEVVSQNILTLTLSQPVDLTQYSTYVIFLQLKDGTVDNIPITAGATNREVILSRAPRLSLALDDDLYARCLYTIVGDNEAQQTAFLLTEKSPQNNMTYTLRGVNYDSRYYQNDLDYIYGIVNEDGAYL